MAKGRLYFTCVSNVLLYGSETRPVKEEGVIRLLKNNARIVRWIYNVMLLNGIFAEELRTRLKLNYIQDYNGLFIWKKWKRMLGLLSSEPSIERGNRKWFEKGKGKILIHMKCILSLTRFMNQIMCYDFYSIFKLECLESVNSLFRNLAVFLINWGGGGVGTLCQLCKICFQFSRLFVNRTKWNLEQNVFLTFQSCVQIFVVHRKSYDGNVTPLTSRLRIFVLYKMRF